VVSLIHRANHGGRYYTHWLVLATVVVKDSSASDHEAFCGMWSSGLAVELAIQAPASHDDVDAGAEQPRSLSPICAVTATMSAVTTSNIACTGAENLSRLALLSIAVSSLEFPSVPQLLSSISSLRWCFAAVLLPSTAVSPLPSNSTDAEGLGSAALRLLLTTAKCDFSQSEMSLLTNWHCRTRRSVVEASSGRSRDVWLTELISDLSTVPSELLFDANKRCLIRRPHSQWLRQLTVVRTSTARRYRQNNAIALSFQTLRTFHNLNCALSE